MSIQLRISKKTLYHIAGWCICWLVLAFEDYSYYPYLFRCLITNFINTLFFVPVIYFNVWILVPRLLLQKRNYAYLFLSMSIICIVCFSLNYIHFRMLAVAYYQSWGAFFAISTELSALYVFSTVIRFVQSYHKAETALREVKTQNLEMELGLLKSQINPHFLFNTLSNLYFLIEKNKVHAQEVVLKLSNHLSHQLYDNSKDMVEVTKEVENLVNYIELESLRSAENTTVSYEFTDALNNRKIAPMLLQPLLENAFKHGNTSATSPGYIKCSLTMEDQILYFYCENSFEPAQSVKENSGIGLHNVRRRLDLLYPDRYRLDITVQDSIFKLQLQISLDETKYPHH